MASQSSNMMASFVAGADLSAKQYYMIKLSADDTVVICAAATDVPVGILQNEPASGEVAEVLIGGKGKCVASAAIAAGALIGTDASGKADAKVPGTDTTNYIVGQVTKASAADGDVLEGLFNFATPFRAA